MNIIGIEGTAHTASIGIVNSNGDILGRASSMLRPPEGGIHPREAANHHAKELPGLISQALDDAEIGHNELGLVAFSQGPGLGPCLRTAATAARALSLGCGIPIIGVNHCVAHIEIGRLVTKAEDPVLLYASGGNTQVIGYSRGKYRVFGETLDIGIGNMLDKFGRIIGLGFPAGQKIEELAKKGKYVELPYIVKGMDMSFSGILTRCEQLLQKGISKEDLCFSVQETCFAMLAEVTERAMAHNDKQELLLVGGVGANKRFCEMLGLMCKERNAKFYNVPMDLAGDQGAMIAWEGYLRREESRDIEVIPHWRTDEV